MLSKSSRANDLRSVRALIIDNCIKAELDVCGTTDERADEEEEVGWEQYAPSAGLKLTTVEDEWIERSISKVTNLIDQQLKRFRNDLVGYKQRGQGLAHDMLASFFSHVVQTTSIAGDAPARSRLVAQMRELDGQMHALVQLHAHGMAIRNDAEQLGKAMARRFEDSLLYAEVLRDACSVRLPEIDNLMRTAPPQSSCAHWEQEKHLFAYGQMGDFVVLVDSLRNNYGLDAVSRADGQPLQLPSLFECVSRLLWKQATIDSFGAGVSRQQSGRDGAFGRCESECALQLRAITVAQMTRYYLRGPKPPPVGLRALLDEPVEDYLARLRVGNAPGDSLCLWHLAQHLMREREIRFRVWLPGISALPVIVPQPRVRTVFEASTAFDLIVVAPASAADASAAGTVLPRAAAYAPLFTPLLRRKATGSASFSAAAVAEVREFTPDNPVWVPSPEAAASHARMADARAAKRARQY